MASKKVEETFEALYSRLEETVAKLEAGNLSLEESLSLYEGGMKLAKQCQAILESAELRITRLQEQFADGAGTLRDEVVDYDATETDDQEQGIE